jgi:hypothetical protein
MQAMRTIDLLKTGVASALFLLSGAIFCAAQAQSQAVGQPVQNCLRAFNGKCVKSEIAEATRLRAVIVPSVRVSYFGTPAGGIGGNDIPFERFFQDNDTLFGLPSVTCSTCITFRSK